MRSIRARLIAVTFAVALVAIVATAWVANRETSREVRDAVEEDLRTESEIYEALSFHAFSTGTWAGVEDLVESLSAEYDERIALTDVDGEVIADSAMPAEGDPQPLPDTPVGFIDPGSPVISFDEPEASPFLAGVEELIVQGEELAAWLERAGAEFTISADDFGIDYPVWDETDGLAEGLVDWFFRERFVEWEPGPFELPPEVLGFLNEQAIELAGFLDEAGVRHRVAAGPLGLQFIEWDYGDPDANRAIEEFYEGFVPGEVVSIGDVLPIGLPEEPAAPALLFLGFPDQSSAIPDPVGWRLLVTVAVVGLLAVVVTALASRRILRPVDALTGAARRLESGDLSERVRVEGGDEVAVLAGAFNSMAESLEEQDRLRRSLTSDIAHELRTPLSNIRGYLEAIQEGVASPSPEVIGSIHEEAVHLQRLIDDLQELALAESGQLAIERSTTDLAALLEQVAQAHRAAADAAGVTLAVGRSPSIAADVDAGRIRQVVANLVDNAIRHTPAGGRVDLSLAAEGAGAVIEVSDSGAGIPPEELPHVFERLYRVDRSRNRATGGTGLGLAIARELVRAHGGEISAASTPGAGSTFRVTLPAG